MQKAPRKTTDQGFFINEILSQKVKRDFITKSFSTRPAFIERKVSQWPMIWRDAQKDYHYVC